ncbi:MAG: heavy metal translocating P-type ATPase metal-binding domain-containing protein [Saprospiraceae bacterium]|nr:heavy metal translocating P-type ATPase metal-binding domain-containing protein [Saprospiraceae bacterium]MCB9324494.1 heavy metal translocating P-type ATPase metal-binding domain-containing protein [Lewinellaceae bacterium]
MEPSKPIVETTPKKGETPCYHCGEPCPDTSICIDSKFFCCQGCKMVFEILNENDLCNYYEIDEKAGVSLKGRKQQKYDYLDEKNIIEKLVSYQDDDKTTVTFFLPQIHCSSCIWLLENLYKLNEAISVSRVNFLKKEIFLTFNRDASLRQIVELLASIGYEPEINLGSLERDEDKLTFQRSFYYKLGIAGFAFGNIMLLSFPEYLGLEADSDAWFQSLFGYLNIILALPVLFYSAKDYLQSAWQGLRQGMLNIDVPISLGIISIFGRSVYEIVSQTGAGYLDSFAGLIFFLLVGKWFQQKTYHRLSFERDYKSYFPIAVTVLKAGEEKPVSINKIEEGDIVLVRHSELIPADGLMLKGTGKIDYAFVTGEAEPVAKTAGEKIYAGGRQVGDSIEITVTKKVSQSYLVQLWNNEAFEKKAPNTTSKIADRIGKIFTIVILIVAFSTLLYWLQYDITTAVNAFTSVLIIACPCAVALSIPFTFGNVLRVLAKHQFYLKNTSVIESLRDMGAVVFDKTGTLTFSTGSEVIYDGEALTDPERSMVHALASQSIHPLSRQIAGSLLNSEEEPLSPSLANFREFTGKGTQAEISGHLTRLGSAEFLEINTPSNGADKSVYVEIDGKIKGHFTISNTYREGFKNVLLSFQEKMKTYLISGDNDSERIFLEPLFNQNGAVLFRQSPQEKLEFIKKLQSEGTFTGMIGDGLNDAGALQQSDIGIVISENINNFTPASDAILHASKFASLPKMTEYARKSVQLVYAAYGLALIYNVIGLTFAVQGVLSPIVAAILMPASSITIAVFGVVSSSLVARRMRL